MEVSDYSRPSEAETLRHSKRIPTLEITGFCNLWRVRLLEAEVLRQKGSMVGHLLMRLSYPFGYRDHASSETEELTLLITK